MSAFDPKEKPKLGHRSSEWTATSMTEAGVVGEMARNLQEISEGRALSKGGCSTLRATTSSAQLRMYDA
jgi:hypothetical protein